MTSGKHTRSAPCAGPQRQRARRPSEVAVTFASTKVLRGDPARCHRGQRHASVGDGVRRGAASVRGASGQLRGDRLRTSTPGPTPSTKARAAFGTDFFDYLAQHPELSAQFNAAMRQGTQTTAAVLPTSYDFSSVGTVVDIGGGDGTPIAALLHCTLSCTGSSSTLLRETPRRQLSWARQGSPRAAGWSSATSLRRFRAGDLYLLKSVVHDWRDDLAATILRHCRRVIPDHGRLLIIEAVLPDAVDPSIPAMFYLSDLNMLVNVGGGANAPTPTRDTLPGRRLRAHRGHTASCLSRVIADRSHTRRLSVVACRSGPARRVQWKAPAMLDQRIWEPEVAGGYSGLGSPGEGWLSFLDRAQARAGGARRTRRLLDLVAGRLVRLTRGL